MYLLIIIFNLNHKINQYHSYNIYIFSLQIYGPKKIKETIFQRKKPYNLTFGNHVIPTL